MKKLVKFVIGTAAVAGTVCGAAYLLKKVFGVDLFNKDTDDDDDFDDGFDDIDDDDDEDTEDREYVTLDMEEENGGSEEPEETETPKETKTAATEAAEAE